MRAGGRLTAVLLSALAVSSIAAAEPLTQRVEEHRNDVGEIERRGDGFVHRSSGYVFPAVLGDMPARSTTTYGTGDASAYYTLLGGGNGDPWLTLYVYPVTRSVEEEVADIRLALLQRMPGTAISPPAAIPPAPAGVEEQWYDAVVEGEPLTTGYRLGRSGDWYIKVRLSIPRSGGQAGLDRAWKALAAIPWTIPQADVPAASVSAVRSAR